jgi:cytoskeletal protein CcmA (bactofilin family)
MSSHEKPALWLALILTSLGIAAVAGAQDFGRTVVVDEPIDHDFYGGGREIEVAAPVTGDVVVAGRNVLVSGNVSGDVIAAGRNVTLTGQVADDARLAGRTVTIEGQIAGHVVAAGSEVQVESDSLITDFAWLSGRHIEIAGHVGGDLKAMGRTVSLTGQVDGDAELAGRDIRIGNDAIIGGNLTWRGDTEPQISETAVIHGEIIHGTRPHGRHSRRGGIIGRVIGYLSVIIAAGVLYSVFQPWSVGLATTVQSRPWATMLTGLATLATTPVIIVLLFVTGIGSMIGLTLMLAYALALMLGVLVGVIAAAQLVSRRAGHNKPKRLLIDWLAIAVVVILMGALYVVRPAGILVGTVVTLFGLGALMLDAYKRFRASQT